MPLAGYPLTHFLPNYFSTIINPVTGHIFFLIKSRQNLVGSTVLNNCLGGVAFVKQTDGLYYRGADSVLKKCSGGSIDVLFTRSSQSDCANLTYTTIKKYDKLIVFGYNVQNNKGWVTASLSISDGDFVENESSDAASAGSFFSSRGRYAYALNVKSGATITMGNYNQSGYMWIILGIS